MDFDLMREQMVREQLIPRGISDRRVLQAFRKVPRHEFVPDEYKNASYNDYPLPIGTNQTISQPYMVALMTQCLGLEGGEKVLEVGTGSGYQLAVLAEIAQSVYSVERYDELAAAARRTLDQLGYNNFMIKTGDGTVGWDEFAPYDGIVVTAGSPTVPQSLIRQLKDGGRIVIPVGSQFSQVLTVIERNGTSIKSTSICGCVFVPLVGKEGWISA